MITQYKIRKYKHVSDAEKYDLLNLWIESLKNSKKELEKRLVKQGLAHYEIREGRELPPTKQMYIDAHGIDDWNEIKRISEPYNKFIKHW